MTDFTRQLLNTFISCPDHTAFVIREKKYTYKELQLLVQGIVSALSQNALYEPRIGVIQDDSLETYASLIGILMLGKAYVPLNLTHPVDKISQIIEQSGVQTLLSSRSLDERDELTGLKQIYTPALSAETLNTAFAPAEMIATNEAYVLFTSGTTGIPKGVPISYGNLNAFLGALQDQFGAMKPDDRCLQMFDLTFDLSVMSYLAPLCYGAAVCTVPADGVKYLNIYNILETQQVTVALMVPSMVQLLQPYFSEIHLPALRLSLFCGEALLGVTVSQWKNCVPNAAIWNVYGPTEATIFCTCYLVPADVSFKSYNDMVSIGKEMTSTRCIIVDEHNNEVAGGNKGQLCISGSQLTNGYLNNPEKNRTTFFTRDGVTYYLTGDICMRDEAGDMSYCGRVDHQVKIQGFRVELSEIEFFANQCTGRHNTIAVVRVNAKKIDELHLFTEPVEMTDEALQDELKKKLPPYMVPQFIHRVTSFPLNQNGKTDRNALLKQISA